MLKQAEGQAVYDAERESKILQQAVANNSGPAYAMMPCGPFFAS